MARGIRCATATNDPSMPSSHHLLNIGPLALHSGRVLPDVQLAYATYGQLSARGDNAILVTHGYTASHALLAHGSGVAAQGHDFGQAVERFGWDAGAAVHGC